jgi:hypothetical protein
MDRGDRDNQKGHYILDVTGSELVEQFVPNLVSPTFLKIDMYDILEMTIAEINQKFKNNFVDVMIDVSFANRISITNFLEKIADSKYRKVEFFTYVGSQESDEAQTVEFDIQDEFNIGDIFSHYLNAKDYSQTVKDDLTQRFNQTFKKVKELNKYA